MERMKPSKGTIIRTLVFVLSMANLILKFLGKEVLPIDEAQINDAVSCLWAVGASFVVWWKNNSFTKNAILADDTLKKMKKEGE